MSPSRQKLIAFMVGLIAGIVIVSIFVALSSCGMSETVTETTIPVIAGTEEPTPTWEPAVWVITKTVNGESVSCIISLHWGSCNWPAEESGW